MINLKFIPLIAFLSLNINCNASENKVTSGKGTSVSSDFKIPETQYEKLKLLDELETTIESGKKEVVEWQSFRSKLQTADNYSSSLRDFKSLNSLVKLLKESITQTIKNPNKIEYIEKQNILEKELLSRIDRMIPMDLKLVFDWFRGVESTAVISEIRSFQQIIDGVLSQLNKNEFYFSANTFGNISISKESLIFSDTNSVNLYIESLQKVTNEIPKLISSSIKIIDDKISSTQTKIDISKENLSKIYKEDNKKIDINGLAIKIGLPAFCLTILLLYLIPEILKRHNPEIRNDFSALLQLITVFLLTMTILILGLSGLLTGEVLGTLIGGISGYVLNKTVNQVKTDTPT